MVEGEMRSKKWESKEGVERTSFEIQADEVIFLGGLKGRERAPEADVDSLSQTG